jgi:hypothetical protein
VTNMTRHEVTTRRVLYEIPEMRSVHVREGEFTGADGKPLPLVVYSPVRLKPDPHTDRVPVVILLAGYPDPGFEQRLGCRFMDMEWTISMAQLIAASGIAAITHSNRDPKADAQALIDYVTTHGAEIGVDGTRLGIWVTSGHAPVAMTVLSKVACAVLNNPFIPPDFASLPPRHRPLFIVRSGRDETPGLNAALDPFIHAALTANEPVTIVNLAEAPHSYDLFHDTDETRHVLQQGLAFLRLYLAA